MRGSVVTRNGGQDILNECLESENQGKEVGWEERVKLDQSEYNVDQKAARRSETLLPSGKERQVR